MLHTISIVWSSIRIAIDVILQCKVNNVIYTPDPAIMLIYEKNYKHSAQILT